MTPYEKDILSKRFQTTMIGALFEFEKAFGHLWGINKDIEHLTETEMLFEERWNLVRNRILNNGNNQLRKCLADFDDVKYHYKLHNKRKDHNQ